MFTLAFPPVRPVKHPRPRVLLALLLVLVPATARAEILNFTATIDAAQEVPPTGEPGTGSGTFVMDTEANTLEFHIEFSGLSSPETAAHIHGFAPAGQEAGILFSLPGGSPKDGTWNFAENQEAGIINGLTYVNIHTQNYPDGEIRGQIVQVVLAPALSGIATLALALLLAAAGTALLLRRRRAHARV